MDKKDIYYAVSHSTRTMSSRSIFLTRNFCWKDMEQYSFTLLPSFCWNIYSGLVHKGLDAEDTDGKGMRSTE